MNKLKIGLKSILFRRRQYIQLITVCAVGISLSLFCVFLVSGMLSSLIDKARFYYGGDYIFFGGKIRLGMDNSDEVVETLKRIFPLGTKIAARIDYEAENASFYFEGFDARQRIVKGINFKKEADLFSMLNYVEGSSESMEGENGILLSEPISRHLNVKVGDEITFMLRTIDGYINTIQLVVHGIFRDSSLFGMYTSYVDIDVLRNARGHDKNFANRICIDLPEGYKAEKLTSYYQGELEKYFNMYPLVEDKDDFYKKLRKFTEMTYLFVPMSTNLLDLRVLLDSMYIVSSFIIIMLIIIIAVGVSSAYRVIVMKRINEIGIYTAIGMKRSEIVKLFLGETLILMIGGITVGLIFSIVLCRFVLMFNLSFIPALDVFLTNGMLVPQFSFGAFIFIAAIVCVTTIVAVLFSIHKSVKMPPVEALAVTE